MADALKLPRLQEATIPELSIPDIIALKRDGQELTKQQIEFIIKRVVSKEIGESQIGQCCNPLTYTMYPNLSC